MFSVLAKEALLRMNPDEHMQDVGYTTSSQSDRQSNYQRRHCWILARVKFSINPAVNALLYMYTYSFWSSRKLSRSNIVSEEARTLKRVFLLRRDIYIYIGKEDPPL